MKWRVWVSVVGLGILGSACGGPQLGRIGPPIPLPNGTPRNACESEEWLELAPARLNVILPAGTVSYSQLHEGAGVFQTGDDQPTPLEDLWPKLQEPQLMRRHQARIEPTDAKSRRAAYWLLGGLVGLGAGVGTGIAVRDESKSTSDALIGVGIGLGSVGLLMELLTMPSPEEQLAANARRRLFKPREDDLLAVARGVDRANANRRRQCGANPVPFDARVSSLKKPGIPRHQPSRLWWRPHPPHLSPNRRQRRTRHRTEAYRR
jgi:hypothetical protein